MHRCDATQRRQHVRSSYPPSPSPSRPLSPAFLISYTAEVLAPVLAAGPFVERKVFDFAAELAAREGDRDITEVGRDARMPWEIDGRRWHTVERVGRTGNPAAGTAASWPT